MSGSLDIIRIDLREDWISQPWGVKNHHIPVRKVSIHQKLLLTAKHQQDRNGRQQADPSVTRQRAAGRAQERHSLVYTFEEPSSDSMLNDEAIDQFMDEIKELRSAMFHPPEVVKRNASRLRKRLLNRFHGFNPNELTLLTDAARRRLSPHYW